MNEGKPVLKRFASVAGELIGSKHNYAGLTNIHVSEDFQRRGIGYELFSRSKEFVKSKGAGKLYIYAQSAVERRRFMHGWAAPKPRNTADTTPKKNPATARWSAI